MLLSPLTFRRKVRCCFNHFDTNGVALSQQAQMHLNGALLHWMLQQEKAQQAKEMERDKEMLAAIASDTLSDDE